MTNNIYELAINQSRDGQHQDFLKSRQLFVDVLSQEKATLNEGKWKPFFTVTPDTDLETILIGMTHWNSMQGFGETASRLMPQQVTVDYFSSFNPLAYALLETVDGKSFDFESIKKEGTVVEFAIRKGKSPDSFGQRRTTFFESLEDHEGYLFSREFIVHKLNAQGMPSLAENTQAVIIVWEDPASFQKAAEPVFGSKEYQDFASDIEVESYFAAFPAN